VGRGVRALVPRAADLGGGAWGVGGGALHRGGGVGTDRDLRRTRPYAVAESAVAESAVAESAAVAVGGSSATGAG